MSTTTEPSVTGQQLMFRRRGLPSIKACRASATPLSELDQTVVERVEQEMGGLPSKEVWDELIRVATAARDGEIILSSIKLSAATADDDFSALTVGEFVYHIDGTQHDEDDGAPHYVRTSVGDSGEVYFVGE